MPYQRRLTERAMLKDVLSIALILRRGCVKGSPSDKIISYGRHWRNPDGVIEFSRGVIKCRLHVSFREPLSRCQIRSVDHLVFGRDCKHPGEQKQAYERTRKKTG